MGARGTEFIGTELLTQVEGNYDRRIAELAEDINRLNSLITAERHIAWRASAERAVADLYHRLVDEDHVTDAELSSFSILSPPRPDDHKYRIQSLEREIEQLRKARDKALAYIRSLAADQGVVTLAAADLRRIGYGL